jgi:Zn-dependent peptidase ImmA (M78 family)
MIEYTDEGWEELAHKWRQAANVDDAIRLDAPAFVRWMKQAGYIKDYVCVSDSDLPGADGKYEPDEGRLYFRESSWNGACRGNPHDVWTLIHEGSHAILKHKETRLRATSAARQHASRRVSHDEAATNRLAASILAPFDKADFKLGMSTMDIQERFGLSRPAAIKRLEEFERMFRRKHGIPRQLPPGIIDFLAKQKRKGFPVTSLDNIKDMAPEPLQHFEGDPCPVCGGFTLVRSGVSTKCNRCGARLGDD